MASVRLTSKFVVEGEPQGKGRPKFRRFGNAVSTYTPEKTVSYESLIRNEFHMQTKNPYHKTGHVELVVHAFVGIPESKSKSTKGLMRNGALKPTKKPDIDNIIKVSMDALNGVAWHDDKQVCSVLASKVYSEHPRLEIEIVGEIDDNCIEER